MGSSGVACTRTGTSSRARRSVSAMARSSPKFGRATMTPSIRSECLRNSAAQRFASSYVSTAPYLLSSTPSVTTSMPASSSTRNISSRPDFARWSGKRGALGVFVRFHGAVFALFDSQRYHVNAGQFEHAQHFFAARFCQMVGEKTAVADDQPECHLLPLLGLLT